MRSLPALPGRAPQQLLQVRYVFYLASALSLACTASAVYLGRMPAQQAVLHSDLAPEPATLHGDGEQAVLHDDNDMSPPSSVRGPVMAHNFPDPTIVQHEGVWYAFGTNNPPSPFPHVQVATSWDFATWTLNLHDALLDTGPWSVGNSTWAPSVIQRPNGDWVLYYTNPPRWAPKHHCIGAAVSPHVAGPYVPVSPAPLICDLRVGGAIDPAAFRDADGSYWLVYKVDGNSLGSGGACNNDVPPIQPTPLMLQRVADDLVTLLGDPVELLTNDHPDDGPDIEAPSLVVKDGTYYLFYSSNCFTSPLYDIAYATADRIEGPYRRQRPLLRTGDLGLVAPGGAGVDLDAQHVVFHANCPQGRCMYTGLLTLNGTRAEI